MGVSSLGDYYKVLGIERDATHEEIRKAYRKLAKKYHPDSNPNDETAKERFLKVNEAHLVLANKDKKADYDKKLFGGGGFGKTEESFTRTGSQGNINYEDFARTGTIFEDFFSFNPKTKEHSLNQKNNDVKPMKTKDAFGAIFGNKKF